MTNATVANLVLLKAGTSCFSQSAAHWMYAVRSRAPLSVSVCAQSSSGWKTCARCVRACLFFCVQVGPTTARFSASHLEYRCCGVLWEDEQSNLFPSTSRILWYVEGAVVPKRTTSNQWRQSGMLLDLVVGGEAEVVVDFLRRVSVWQQKRFRTWTLCHSLALVRDEYCDLESQNRAWLDGLFGSAETFYHVRALQKAVTAVLHRTHLQIEKWQTS